MYSFGWKPDLPDHRDFKYSALMPSEQPAFQLPPRVDLRANMSPIEDQGQLGSCVAHATVGALEFLELQALSTNKTAPETFSKKFTDLSRMFVYANARIIDGDLSQDGGTQLRSAVMAIRKWGICEESIWPYNPQKVFSHPSISAYFEGRKHLIPVGYRLDNSVLTQLQACLAAGFPFVFGVSVFESFMSEQAAKTGNVPMPEPTEGMLGGHALCCVGYDDTTRLFIVRNSWSTLWGDLGYCYLPYDYLTNLDLAADFWTLRN